MPKCNNLRLKKYLERVRVMAGEIERDSENKRETEIKTEREKEEKKKEKWKAGTYIEGAGGIISCSWWPEEAIIYILYSKTQILEFSQKWAFFEVSFRIFLFFSKACFKLKYQ